MGAGIALMASQLITQVPSVANGDLAEDLTSVTFRLNEGVLWSDGEPLNANDVALTIEWALDEANAVTSYSFYETIDSTDVVDELTVTINFKAPKPNWADAYTGMGADWCCQSMCWKVPIKPTSISSAATRSALDLTW